MSQEEQYRRVAKNTVTLGGAQLVQMGVTLIRAKIVAILLGATGMGINSLMLSVISVMQQVSAVGIYQSGVREMSVIAGENKQKLSKFRKIFLLLSLVCGLGGMLLMILLSPLLSLLLFNNFDYMWWLALGALTLVFMALYSGYSVIMQATQNVGLMAKSSMAGAVLGLVLIIPLFYFFGIFAIIPAIILNYAAFYLSFRYFEHKIDFDRVCQYTKKEFLTYSGPILKLGVILMASMIATTFFSFMLNLFINRFGSIEEVGLYQSAASIITQGMLIINVILASDFFLVFLSFIRIVFKCSIQ
ncbi:oligosaccharide flippase family protein [Bacteroides fragilis]|nr:oligosaccharide flippase family protein [Bacteroides fragilis]